MSGEERSTGGSRPAPAEGPASIDPARLAETVQFIRRQWQATAACGLILGTGMGAVAGDIDVQCAWDCGQVPNLPRSTAPSHHGRLVCGRLAGKPVVVMQGRCHLYEGYRPEQITLPVHLMRALGAQLLVACNASGGINPQLRSGDIVLIDSHINLMWSGFVAPSMLARLGRPIRANASPYDDALIEHALTVARRENFAACRGVYVGVTGPNYETRAEYRFFRRIGGDVVGMSTVPEVITAAALGMRVLAISIVTNVARPDAPQRVESSEVVAAAGGASARVAKIIMAAVAL